MTLSGSQQITRTAFFWALLFLCLTRLLSMQYTPLNDSTEARYGEIARIMLETHNWITPMHQYNQPFWAKPPLSMWLSALSMKALGISAFAARFPSILLSLAILALVWQIARQRHSASTAMIATLVLAGSSYFYLDAGTVMTDPSLLLTVSLMMLAFWQAVVEQRSAWRYVFFIGMGLGLLAKGPVAIVLVGMPIGLWIVLEQRWREVWNRLPWIYGLLLTCIIALPWYILAEIKTPGFLRYFIIGEHIGRFLIPGWQGDKYGFAHMAPYGMIWIYALLGTLPWCIPGMVWLYQCRGHLKEMRGDPDGWIRYLLLWAFLPLIFFTFARNIIYPYVFPSLPAFALLFAEFMQRAGIAEKHGQKIAPITCIVGVVFLIATGLFVKYPELIAKSQDRVVAVYKAQHPATDSRIIYWTARTDYSAQFYSAGHATSTLYPKVLCGLLRSSPQNFVVLDSEETRPIPETLLSQLHEIGEVQVLAKQYRIFEADQPQC